MIFDTSNDPSEVMTYAGLYEIGDKASYTCYMNKDFHYSLGDDRLSVKQSLLVRLRTLLKRMHVG